MTDKKKEKWHSLVNFYRLYTQGLTRQEIERLLKQESVDMYSFYKRKSDIDNRAMADASFPMKQLAFVWELFLSFVLRLTPARRLFYGIACVLFLTAFIINNWIYAFAAFLLFNFLLAFELADRMLAKDELDIAREIQIGLQPDESPVFPGVDIAVFYRPAKEVGGDYYDILPADDKKFGLMIGDVSGKGLPAALYAVKMQGLVELLIQRNATPKTILSGINTIMSRRLKKKYFITAAFAVFNVQENSVMVTRAGHVPPLHYNYRSNKTEWLVPDGVGIGIDNNSFDSQLQEKTVVCNRGDIFLFYTDGLTEAMNQTGQEFGESRLEKIVLDNVTATACKLKEAIVHEMQSFADKTFLEDDVTLIVVKIK